MPGTTPVYGWPYPIVGADPPNGAQQIQDAVTAIEDTVSGLTTVGLPASALTAISSSVWTDFCSVTITLPVAQEVEIVAWARLTNTGASRAMVSLQVLDGSTHLMGLGQTHMGGSGDQFGDEITLALPRRKFALAAGAHTINLQGYKDVNGIVNMKKTDTYASQVIATTGIEVTQ